MMPLGENTLSTGAELAGTRKHVWKEAAAMESHSTVW